VAGVPSLDLVLKAPPSILLQVGESYNVTGAFGVTDHDDDAYSIGVHVIASPDTGVFSFHSQIQKDITQFVTLTTSSCNLALELGCDNAEFVTSPSGANEALSTLLFTANTAMVNSSLNTLVVFVYKPYYDQSTFSGAALAQTTTFLGPRAFFGVQPFKGAQRLTRPRRHRALDRRGHWRANHWNCHHRRRKRCRFPGAHVLHPSLCVHVRSRQASQRSEEIARVAPIRNIGALRRPSAPEDAVGLAVRRPTRRADAHGRPHVGQEHAGRLPGAINAHARRHQR